MFFVHIDRKNAIKRGIFDLIFHFKRKEENFFSKNKTAL